MRLRHLRIRVSTDRGLFGVDIPFGNGLIVLRAENSMGKSTCLRSILVALGMEAALTTSREDLPLPPVLKRELHTEDGDARVIESDIFVEIENRDGERVVVHRTVKGSRDPGLIEVTKGPALTVPGHYRSDQFFVGRAGDSTRELGFLRFLVRFLGWNIPMVRTFRGDDRPLYLQCLAPYFFVEQSRGWSALEPPLATRFGIMEIHRRAVEFLLALDAIEIAAKRLELEETERAIQGQWKAAVAAIDATAAAVDAVVQRVPPSPVATWPLQIPPVLTTWKEGAWISLEDRHASLRTRLTESATQGIPSASENADIAEERLAEVQEVLADRHTVLSRLLEMHSMETAQASATEDRLRSLEEDLQRNKDTLTLQHLGGSGARSIVSQQCPICHQEIVDSLTPLAAGQSVMSIEENIGFLEEQRRTFQAVLIGQRRVVETIERQVGALRSEVSLLRSRIRALKETLVSDGRIPSVAEVFDRVQLQEDLERVGRAMNDFSAHLDDLRRISQEWRLLQLAKDALPTDDTSPTDKRKIGRWSSLVQDQLRQYEFKSLAVSQIAVSGETYRPSHEGYDLPTSISASDFIRVIWAYLNGLRELSLEFATNHPGLLVFDEPRQQSTKDFSFEQLLRRVASAGAAGHQVVFATSEKEESLQRMLDGVPHTYLGFPGYLIRRLADG